MRFKRPQVRYADTPQPATPYQSAAQVWDERIGSARVQARNWRFMAFGCLTLAVLMAGGLVWRSAQSDRKSTRLNSSHQIISYAVFFLKKKKKDKEIIAKSLQP